MTEKDFYLLCVGHNEVELNRARERRQLMYVIVCGYADPKKLPPINRWMPLDGDPVHQQMSTEEALKLHEQFVKSRKWREKIVN